jgi:hypothetical protein
MSQLHTFEQPFQDIDEYLMGESSDVLLRDRVEIKEYVKTHMILCQVFGLCSKKIAIDCPHFSAWTDVTPFEQECEWCISQEKLNEI